MPNKEFPFSEFVERHTAHIDRCLMCLLLHLNAHSPSFSLITRNDLDIFSSNYSRNCICRMVVVKMKKQFSLRTFDMKREEKKKPIGQMPHTTTNTSVVSSSRFSHVYFSIFNCVLFVIYSSHMFLPSDFYVSVHRWRFHFY